MIELINWFWILNFILEVKKVNFESYLRNNNRSNNRNMVIINL